MLCYDDEGDHYADDVKTMIVPTDYADADDNDTMTSDNG